MNTALRGIAQLVLADLRLSYRVRIAFFFSYIFPLITFFMYSLVFGKGNPKAIPGLVGPILTVILLGNALFGVANQLTGAREGGSLRVYYLHPIQPWQILVGKGISNTLLFLPVCALILLLARLLYGLHLQAPLGTALLFLGSATFFVCAMGILVATLVESSAGAQVANQVLFLVLLFLSGTTIPLGSMPEAGRILAGFLPTSHVVTLFNGMVMESAQRGETWARAGILGLTTFGWIWVSGHLFRWDGGHALTRKAHALVALTCLPLLAFGLFKALHS